MFDDLTLKSKIRIELGVRDISKDTVEVEVKDGRVTLTGTVDAQEKVKEAEKAAISIEGVVGVENKLELES